eukprot:5775667-Lingulodinium_polyedra.AAC.1
MAEAIFQMQQTLKQATSKEIEVPMPETVEFSPVITDWKHPVPKPGAKRMRNTFPFKTIEASFDTMVEQYEATLMSLGQDTATIAEKVLAMNRFWSCFIVSPPGEYNAMGVLCKLYEKNMLPLLFDFDLMDIKYGWARDMRDHLNSYLAYVIDECTRLRFPEAKFVIDRLRVENMPSQKAKGMLQRKLMNFEREQVDADRLDNLASTEVEKEAVKRAMMDLESLCIECSKWKGLDLSRKVLANTCIIGIIYLNGFAGRCMEWETMDKSHKHKTVKKYGYLGKYLAPGTVKAIEKYLSLPGKSSDLFLEHASHANRCVSIPSYLKRFGATYMPKNQPPAVNLLRKQFHKSAYMQALRARENATFKVMEIIDKHSPRIGKQVYVPTTPKDDAYAAKEMYIEVKGPPVEWPPAPL